MSRSGREKPGGAPAEASNFIPASLRVVAERRLLEAIDEITGAKNNDNPDQRWCVLVVDDFFARIISAITTTNELTKHQISHVEPLRVPIDTANPPELDNPARIRAGLPPLPFDEKVFLSGRKPFPGLEAIYIMLPDGSIMPDLENIDILLDDFEHADENPFYAKVHLLFTQTVTDDHLRDLAGAQVAHRIATCSELNMAFAPIDAHAFILSSYFFSPTTTLHNLYNPPEPQDRQDAIEDGATGLFSMIVSLNLGLPKVVRWAKGNSPTSAAHSDEWDLARESAELLGQHLEDTQNWETPLEQGNATVLVLDRSFDLQSVLLDHHHCGSLLMDHPSSSANSTNFHIEIEEEQKFGDCLCSTVSGDNKPVGNPKLIHLVETNKVWQQLRFQSLSGKNFGHCCGELRTLIQNRYPSAAKLVKWDSEKKDMKNMTPAEKKIRKKGIRELHSYNESVRTLAMVKEMLFSIVLGPPEDDGDKRRERVDQRAMMLQFQQAVAMGKQDQYVLLSREATREVTASDQLREMLKDDTYSENMRKRMFLLYALAVRGNFQSEDRKLLDSEPLGVDYWRMWDALQRIHMPNWYKNQACNLVPPERDVESHMALHNPIFAELMDNENGMVVPTYLSDQSESNQEDREDFLHQAQSFNAFTPRVFNLAEMILSDNASEEDLPFVGDFREEMAAKRLKGEKPSWFSRKKEKTKPKEDALIIFVNGGITHAEIQAVYELMSKHKINIYIGGTHLATSTNFVDDGLEHLLEHDDPVYDDPVHSYQ